MLYNSFIAPLWNFRVRQLEVNLDSFNLFVLDEEVETIAQPAIQFFYSAEMFGHQLMESV